MGYWRRAIERLLDRGVLTPSEYALLANIELKMDAGHNPTEDQLAQLEFLLSKYE